MKTRNFPGRKWLRRTDALERMKRTCKVNTQNTRAIQNAEKKLEGKTWESECGVMTKKKRGNA